MDMRSEKTFSCGLLLGAIGTLIEEILGNIPIINSKSHTAYFKTTYTVMQNILLIIGMKYKLRTKRQFSESN